MEYPGDEEGDVHCHGIVWAEGASLESFILPLYKFVKKFDHRDGRGYDGRFVRVYPLPELVLARIIDGRHQPVNPRTLRVTG